MYLLVSFDFIGNNIIHAMTACKEDALILYDKLIDDNFTKHYNRLVELVEFPNEFTSVKGHLMFLPNTPGTIGKIIQTNNIVDN